MDGEAPGSLSQNHGPATRRLSAQEAVMAPIEVRGLTNSALRGWAAVAQVRPVCTAAGSGGGERMTQGLYRPVQMAGFPVF
jgi:hypothetical protein